MPVEISRLVDELQLVNHKKTRSLDLIEAIVEPPQMTLTMDGASTLTLTVADHRRKLLNSAIVGVRSWAVVGKAHFELVGLSKSGERFTLTFEDAIVAALRRRTKPLSVPAGSTSRREFAIRLAREARVGHAVDPEKRGNVQRVLERSSSGQKSDSWEVLGEVAEDVRWRRFSDTRRLIMGSDDWLMGRDSNPTVLREGSGPCISIDFDLDVAKRASEATVEVDASLWSLLPGSVVRIPDLGDASGKWLVAEYDRALTTTRATAKLIRKRHELKEPKRRGKGEPGDPDFLPGQGGNKGGAKAGSPARERMVRFALAQTDKPYVWGGSGPAGFDCSGLVQQAARAGGRVLPKPSASQWATVVRAGKTVPISTALRTRGALLFRIGVGDYNHVAISLGNGSTVEARGSAYGIGVFGGAGSGGWTGAGIWI